MRRCPCAASAGVIAALCDISPILTAICREGALAFGQSQKAPVFPAILFVYATQNTYGIVKMLENMSHHNVVAAAWRCDVLEERVL